MKNAHKLTSINCGLNFSIVLYKSTNNKNHMKIVIVGTRNPGVSYQEWESILISKIKASKVSLVVSRGAKSSETYAKLFVARHHSPLMEYLPDYSIYGRKVTPYRNTQIVREESTVIASTLQTQRCISFYSRNVTSLQTSHRRKYLERIS